MADNVRPSGDADYSRLTSAIRSARDLIARRGYQPVWGKGGEHDPLNISEALANASAGDNSLYLLMRQAFSKNWGGPVDGLLNWETMKRRTKAEVLGLLDVVLERLDNGEAHPTGGSSPRGAHTRTT